MKTLLAAAAFALLATAAHAKRDCVAPMEINIDPYFLALAEKGQTLLMGNMTPLYREPTDPKLTSPWSSSPSKLVKSAHVNLGTPMTHVRFYKGDR